MASTGSDSNSGDLLHPFATIQKAIDTINDFGKNNEEYTIYIDGTLTQSAASGVSVYSGTLLVKNYTSFCMLTRPDGLVSSGVAKKR